LICFAVTKNNQEFSLYISGGSPDLFPISTSVYLGTICADRDQIL